MAYLNRIGAIRSVGGKEIFRAIKPVTIGTRRNYLINRHDPFEEMQRQADRMFREFDRMANFRFLRPLLGRALPIETSVDGKRIFRLQIDLPDFKAENIQISAKKGEVSIVAKSENIASADSGIKQNRNFHFKYSIPEDVDLDKVRSQFKTDGRLVISIPLSCIQAKSDKEIPIQKA